MKKLLKAEHDIGIKDDTKKTKLYKVKTLLHFHFSLFKLKIGRIHTNRLI